MWEKGGIFYGLHGSIQGTHHVFFQRLLQSCHTLCRCQCMARQEQAAAKREIIYLYFFGNYTQQEIADLYGQCKSTAWHYIHSALQLLREEKQTVVTLTVAECGEFHNFGEYHEGMADVPGAIAIFNQIPPERMNGIPSIGINIHTEGTESYEDTQMDIVSGRVADLEILDYVPDITDNPKAVEVIAELNDKMPDIEVRGSMEKWQAAFLAAEIDQLSYDFDTYQYNHTVEDRKAQTANITEDIRNANTGYLNDFLNALISDSIREGNSLSQIRTSRDSLRLSFLETERRSV